MGIFLQFQNQNDISVVYKRRNSKRSAPGLENSSTRSDDYLVVFVENGLYAFGPGNCHGVEFNVFWGEQVVVKQVVQSDLDLFDSIGQLQCAQ